MQEKITMCLEMTLNFPAETGRLSEVMEQMLLKASLTEKDIQFRDLKFPEGQKRIQDFSE